MVRKTVNFPLVLFLPSVVLGQTVTFYADETTWRAALVAEIPE